MYSRCLFSVIKPLNCFTFLFSYILFLFIIHVFFLFCHWNSVKFSKAECCAPIFFCKAFMSSFPFLDLYIYLFFPSLMKEWYELQNLIFKTMVEMKRSFLCFLNCRIFNGSSYYARDLGVRCQFQSIMESSVLLKIECFCEFIGVQNLLYLFCMSKLWEHIVCEFLIHLCMNKLLLN